MNRIILLSMMLFAIITSKAQQTAQSMLEQEAVKILQADGVLYTNEQKACTGDCRSQGLWKNDKQKTHKLETDEKLKRRLLQKFQIPSFSANRLIRQDLVFLNKSVGLLGSYIIRNNDLSVINNSTIEPQLPILNNGTQVSVFDPSSDGSNYTLNETSNSLFTGGVQSSAGVEFSSYFQEKLQQNTDISLQNRSQISIGSGQFQNHLAAILTECKDGSLPSTFFEPVYLIWLKYRDSTIHTGDKVLSSFNGLCYFTSKGVEKIDKETVSSATHSDGKYAFLSWGLDASLKWSLESKISSQKNIYGIFMFSDPSTIDIPSPSIIHAWWNNQKPKGKAITLLSNNIPVTAPLVAKVVFGPIPNSNILSLIKIDEQFSLNTLPADKKFIKSIKLITDDQSRIKNDNGYYTFDLEIYRDDNFIAQNYSTIGDNIIADLPIKIFIDAPIGSDTFIMIYDDVKVQAERYPTPSCDFELNPSKDNTIFKYSNTVKFNTTNTINVSNKPAPPKIIDILGLPTALSDGLRKDILAGKFGFKGLNEFDFSFVIPQTAKYFSINQRSLDVELVLSFIASDGIEYKRKLPLRLDAPSEMIQASNIIPQILIRDNNELLGTIDKSAKLSGGKTVQETLSSYTQNDSTGVLDFVAVLKKENLVFTTPDNKYSVNPKIVDFEKLKYNNAAGHGNF